MMKDKEEYCEKTGHDVKLNYKFYKRRTLL